MSEQLDLDIPDRPRLVKGEGGMYYLLQAGETLAGFRADYPATKLDVVPWPGRAVFK